MPVVISPDGQSVWCASLDVVQDRLRQGYRLPAPEPGTIPVELPEPDKQIDLPESEPAPVQVQMVPVAGALDLTQATLAQLRDLPDVGTARARKIAALAKANNLSLDTLQAEVPEADWVAMYSQGMVVWPGGLHVVEK